MLNDVRMTVPKVTETSTAKSQRNKYIGWPWDSGKRMGGMLFADDFVGVSESSSRS